MLENEKGLGPIIKMQLPTSTAFIVLEREENGSRGKKKIVCEIVQMCRNSTSFCGFPRQLLA